MNPNVVESSGGEDDDDIDLPNPEMGMLNQIKECFNTQEYIKLG